MKDILKVGQEVEARVIKVDKVERRIGLSIKAANYSEEQLRKEVESFDTLRPGEDMVGLEKAFAAAEQEEYRPGESKRATKDSSESDGESKKSPKRNSSGFFVAVAVLGPRMVSVTGSNFGPVRLSI